VKKKKCIAVLVLLLLVGLSGTYLAETYAKYISKIESSGTATVAKWNFVTDNEQSTFTVNLAETYDESTLVAGVIAPGTSGSFGFELKNTSDVAVEWEIALEDIANLPTNVKLYSDEDMQNPLVPGTDTITGTLKANETNSLKPTIYWAWEYETIAEGSSEAGDLADTTAGETGATLTINATITGTQMEPSTTPVESKINE